MTAGEMARIHHAAFAPERGWSDDEFRTLLAQDHVQAFRHEAGFALTRTLAGESELLTLAVDPAFQGAGIGRKLLETWLETAEAEYAFLEVAQDNVRAVGLYHSCGFEETGIRRAYYQRPGAAPIDALLMSRKLTSGQSSE